MAVIVQVDGSSVQFTGGGLDEWRPLSEADIRQLDGLAARYRSLREREHDQAGLLSLGRDLYRWLDGDAGWLRRTRAALVPPFELEVRGALRPDEVALKVLQAPWEVLADEHGFLAADALLGSSPVRRLGVPAVTVPLPDLRLGVMFMAAAPYGQQVELDYEAEEDAILRAAGQPGIDLVVEDSGNPERLANRLAALPSIQVLHLSCHGHNGYRADGKPPRPVLLLESEAGEEWLTEAGALVATLGARRPRLLFLSACLTAAAGAKDPTGGVAHSLATAMVSAGVPAVLGWDGSVRDAEASAFAHELYKALALRQPLGQAAGVARQKLLRAERSRDWHLARVWLGPQGGGPVVAGQRKRLLVSPEHGHKEFLDKRGQRSPVASREVFVGRRRELQEALRELRGQAHGGVLLHGMGRLGKSSLAARVAHRRPDMALALVYERYNALAVVEALADGLKDVKSPRELLAEARVRVRDDAGALEGVLLDLVTGPCAQAGESGRPVLLVIDDLERILEPGDRGVHRVQPEFVPVLRAVLRAFDPDRTDSRLVLTSRYAFTLPDEGGGRDLADRLHAMQLPPMTPPARRKLVLRQQQEAVGRPSGERLSDAELLELKSLLERASEVARGNPGLQDLLASLVLAPAAEAGQVERTLAEMEAYLARGDLPHAEEVQSFLEDLALDRLVGLASASARELLRRATVFQVPVPVEVLAQLGEDRGAAVQELRGLGLLDRFEDLVDLGRPAAGLNAMARPKAGELLDSERAEHAKRVLPALFEAWGGSAGRERRTYRAALELTRLGLLADDAEVLEACAADAVSGLERAFAYRQAAALGRRVIEALDRAGRPPAPELLLHTGENCITTGEVSLAEELYQRALKTIATAKSEGRPADAHVEGGLLLAQARLLVQRGEPDAALSLFERVKAVSEQQQHTFNVAVTLGDIILYARGEVDQALRIRQEEQLPVFRQLGCLRELAMCQGRIADILSTRGELDEALRILEYEALPLFEQVRDVRSIAVSHGKIADILQVRGELDEALRIRQEEQLPVFRQLGDVRELAMCQGAIADILRARGELDEALRIRQEYELPVYRELGDVRQIALTQGRIASLLAERGELEQALKIQEERLAINRELGDQDGIAVASWEVARIELKRGNYAEAMPRLQEAYDISARIGRLFGICVVGGHLGQLLVGDSQRDRGLAMLRRSANGYRQLGRPADAEKVEAIIRQIEQGDAAPHE